jgi:glucosamine--fructose-6-phosphate aminotransferase (isomerizing)
MATSSLLGRRVCLAAAQRSTYYQQQAFSAAASATSSHYSYSNNSSSFRFGLLGGATALAFTVAATNNNKNKTSKCCGIAGVVGARGDARDYLIEGLSILKNRGYDSAGIATMDDANPELVVSSSAYFLYLCSTFVCRPAL